ncbi:alkaline phosphatase family protein [Microbacterium sp. ASV49]|uniref:Alkaline phosphatase family protein n=1 Tax=Microbacterium candidum TaxID=3041922 RepID=A0ABT7N2W5_9MICO|nr:alkaline phosphatase family protein [Microbacterium sp. ASV49]MDL9981050.1 alkaline phosphatase family protein [Microbacterium sp. ASV49]
MSRRITTVLAVAALALGAAVASATPALGAPGDSRAGGPSTIPGGFKHLVVIYEENHSFDNLYGGWGAVNGQAVNGTQSVPQVDQNGTPFDCLEQNDVNLDAVTPKTCSGGGITSAFTNHTFTIDDFIKPTDTTCPVPGVFAKFGVLNGTGEPGGCTRDLVHRFYEDQYQENGGLMNRYTTGSDAVGLTQGQYDTKQLPIYQYLHGVGAPNYVLADDFFQAAFGGSFLNHQWLIAARTPLDTSASVTNSVLDANGMPGAYPLYTPTTGPSTLKNTQWTVACPGGGNDYAAACGDFAVNTIQPASAPNSGGRALPLIDDTKYPNIGDRMTAAGISWNWYSGGWDAAENGHPGPNFQFHHQPFNYFAAYAPAQPGVPAQPGRKHLQDETKFIAAAKNGTLPTVSFVKPYGDENEHPGYASEPDGSDHLVDLLKTITSGPDAKNTLIVVTYDEFGGQADHVAPPVVDKWGPGTRIPALLVSAKFTSSGVDHTQYDTTSILATIEKSFHLAPLGTRDAKVNPLFDGIRMGLDG